MPVLCHQPLDFLTKLTIRSKNIPPTATVKFMHFSDRWVVTLGNMFGRVLDPGDHIQGVWKLNIPEGLKEVLWKKMNSALVIGHRYHGVSDMGWTCRCRTEMSLSHILMGCTEYAHWAIMEVLLNNLKAIGPNMAIKMLSPDEWGHSVWYPLLALAALELDAVCPSKTMKKPNKVLRDMQLA